MRRKPFWQNTRREGECMIWTSYVDSDGYGRYGHRRKLAHKLAYEEAYGPVGAGRELDHLCRNRACINPLHLEQVTHRENLMRGDSFAAVNARKTHCSNGHEYTPENTYGRPRGGRDCRVCVRDRARRYKAKEDAA